MTPERIREIAEEAELKGVKNEPGYETFDRAIESAITQALEEENRWIPVAYENVSSWPARDVRVHTYAASTDLVNTLESNELIDQLRFAHQSDLQYLFLPLRTTPSVGWKVHA